MADVKPAAGAATPAAGSAAAVATPAFDPKGKSFSTRVDAFISDVKDQHGIIVTKDAGRTAEWQQKHHIAHMLAFNKYKSTTPKKTDKGGRTIAWDHISDAKLKWDTISPDDLLRTKTGGIPKKGADGAWMKSDEPDKDKTLEHAKKMLKDAGVGNSGEAMVSSGLNPCGEPCGCGAGRSNHLSDLASDLNSTALTQLQQALEKLKDDKKTDIDAYLKKFGLHRPLKDHEESPEPWHVEGLADTKL